MNNNPEVLYNGDTDSIIIPVAVEFIEDRTGEIFTAADVADMLVGANRLNVLTILWDSEIGELSVCRRYSTGQHYWGHFARATA